MPYYPIAEMADRVIDLVLFEDGGLEIYQQVFKAGPPAGWTTTRTVARTNAPVGGANFKFSVVDGGAQAETGLLALTANSWPNSYPPPKLAVLGKLDPLVGNGWSPPNVTGGVLNPNVYRTREATCTFDRAGTLTMDLYRFKIDPVTRLPVSEPNPVTSTQYFVPNFRDGAAIGAIHSLLLLPPGSTGRLEFSAPVPAGITGPIVL